MSDAQQRRFVVRDENVGRAERRLLMRDHTIQSARDLVVARMGERIYLGIRDGGRVALHLDEVDQLAAELLTLVHDQSRLEDPHDT